MIFLMMYCLRYTRSLGLPDLLLNKLLRVLRGHSLSFSQVYMFLYSVFSPVPSVSTSILGLFWRRPFACGAAVALLFPVAKATASPPPWCASATLEPLVTVVMVVFVVVVMVGGAAMDHGQTQHSHEPKMVAAKVRASQMLR